MEHHERPILQENADDGQIGKKKRKRTMKMDKYCLLTQLGYSSTHKFYRMEQTLSSQSI
ncbi:Protein CBG27823 [Caenorhabditis briggsae]|uniref:Protein CBG27823 n=1 Tax=Caenorhabditis briggsae TaxID=6238 RepID=B6IKA5_CAEBR|nr:Protein CBG27823 [Caenorhabditis briggsae]CAS00335.1 Protein CBG27823 [Caenorhabditis briggsae]